MTNTALKNKEIEAKEKIASQDRASREKIEGAKREMERETSKRSARAQIISSGIKGFLSKKKWNDPAWYKSVPELVINTANFPFYSPIGKLYPVNVLGSSVWTVPNVLAIKYHDTVGLQFADPGIAGNNFASVINTALARLQTQLRANNSRIGSYEPGDLGQVLMSGIDLAVEITVLGKAIKAAQTYDGNRIQIGDAILAALGFNPISFRDYLPEWKIKHNLLVKRWNEAIVIPKDFSYAQRKLFLANAIYADDDLRNSQIFVLVPNGIKTYDEANATVEVTHIRAVGYTHHLSSNAKIDFDPDTWFQLMSVNLGKLIHSAALQTMWADIRAAVTDFIKLEPIGMDDMLTIEPVDEVLHQLMNAKMPAFLVKATGTSTLASRSGNVLQGLVSQYRADAADSSMFYEPAETSLAIRQDSNGLLYQGDSVSYPGVHFKVPQTVGFVEWVGTGNLLLNYYKNDIKDDDLLVATRFTSTYWGRSNGTNTYLFVGACGTEVVTSCLIFQCSIQGTYTPGELYAYQFNGIAVNDGLVATSIAVFNMITAFEAFDWRPSMYLGTLSYNGSGYSIDQYRLFMAYGNTFEVSFENVKALHEICVQSEVFINSKDIKYVPYR